MVRLIRMWRQHGWLRSNAAPPRFFRVRARASHGTRYAHGSRVSCVAGEQGDPTRARSGGGAPPGRSMVRSTAARARKRILSAVAAAFSLLAEQPTLGAPVPGVRTDLPTRRVLLRRFPYAIVFLEVDATVRILAIAHQRRRPGYWIERLRR